MDSEKEIIEQESNKSNIIVKVLFILLLILFFLSGLVLTIRLGDLLPNNVDIFFIEPKEPGATFGDDKALWSDDVEIDIFYIEHKNDQGVVTVVSGTGDKVIAPGTKGYYKFNFRNIGNIAIDYICKIDVDFETDGVVELSQLPIKVRLRDYNGKYLIGSNSEWALISTVKEFTDKKTIGKNCFIYYEFEWCWDFESGDDQLDTLLGNISDKGMAKLVIDLDAAAYQSAEYEASGGLPSGLIDPRTGGNIVPVPYIILNLLILILIIIILILKKKQRKRESQELKEIISLDESDSSLNDIEKIEKIEEFLMSSKLRKNRKVYRKTNYQRNPRFRVTDNNKKDE